LDFGAPFLLGFISGGSPWTLSDASCFSPQRAAAALCASSFRRAGSRFFLLFFPPRRPNATAAGFFLFGIDRLYAQRYEIAIDFMHSDV
jgi:hypothetical protein